MEPIRTDADLIGSRKIPESDSPKVTWGGHTYTRKNAFGKVTPVAYRSILRSYHPLSVLSRAIRRLFPGRQNIDLVQRLFTQATTSFEKKEILESLLDLPDEHKERIVEAALTLLPPNASLVERQRAVEYVQFMGDIDEVAPYLESLSPLFHNETSFEQRVECLTILKTFKHPSSTPIEYRKSVLSTAIKAFSNLEPKEALNQAHVYLCFENFNQKRDMIEKLPLHFQWGVNPSEKKELLKILLHLSPSAQTLFINHWPQLETKPSALQTEQLLRRFNDLPLSQVQMASIVVSGLFERFANTASLQNSLSTLSSLDPQELKSLSIRDPSIVKSEPNRHKIALLRLFNHTGSLEAIPRFQGLLDELGKLETPYLIESLLRFQKDEILPLMESLDVQEMKLSTRFLETLHTINPKRRLPLMRFFSSVPKSDIHELSLLLKWGNSLSPLAYKSMLKNNSLDAGISKALTNKSHRESYASFPTETFAAIDKVRLISTILNNTLALSQESLRSIKETPHPILWIETLQGFSPQEQESALQFAGNVHNEGAQKLLEMLQESGLKPSIALHALQTLEFDQKQRVLLLCRNHFSPHLATLALELTGPFTTLLFDTQIQMLNSLKDCESLEEMESTLLAQQVLDPLAGTALPEYSFDPDQPILPQLQQLQDRHVTGSFRFLFNGSPGADAGGLSRALFQKAAREIPTYFEEIFITNAQGYKELTVGREDQHGDLVPLTKKELEKVHLLGTLMRKMLQFEVRLPRSIALDKTLFSNLLSLNSEDLQSATLTEKAASLSEPKLIELFARAAPQNFQQIDNIPGDNLDEKLESLFGPSEERETEIRTQICKHELNFQLAKALTLDGHTQLTQKLLDTLVPPADIRARLLEPNAFSFVSCQLGDVSLLQQHFERYIRESSEEKLQQLVFAATGLDILPPGKKIDISIDEPVSPAVIRASTCFYKLTLPAITDEPLDSYTQKGLHFKNYEQWKGWVDELLPQLVGFGLS